VQEVPIEAARKYVDGVKWPADKERVLEALKSNGAPDDVVQIVRSIDKDRLMSPGEVHLALYKAA
jgi:hypothetical protein